MSHKILAFGHRSGVGKDTAANMVKDILGPLYCERFSFAEELKLECYSLFGTLPPDVYDKKRELRKEKVEGLELNPVELWVKFGEACRDIDPLIWVKKCMQNIIRYEYNVSLISDLRHPNEAKELKEQGAKLIKVESDVPPNPDAKIDGCLEGYDGWDYEIFAKQGDLKTLEKEVRRVLVSEELI